MYRAIAALVLASASVLASAPAYSTTSTLLPNSPWWEKVTVTLSSDGQPQGCRFESSIKPDSAKPCDASADNDTAVASTTHAAGSKDEYTRITFERRFTPDLQAKKLQTGDTLLGGQVMALAIDGRGQVKNCKIVAQTGSMRPDYGCPEASAERFEASAGAHPATTREAYMTIIVYGHQEHVV